MTEDARNAVAGFFVVVFAAAFAVAWLVAVALWDAFVLLKLWGWFVVPAFDLPALTYPLAIGVSLTVAVLVFSPKQYKDHDLAFGHTVINAFFGPATLLAVGWIVTLLA